MKTINLELNINKEEFKRKLGITDGLPGENGSPDSGIDIIKKINKVRSPMVQIDFEHIRGFSVPIGGGNSSSNGSGSGGGANVGTEKITPVASGLDVTLDLTTLAHAFATIQWVAKNGQILDPSDATFGWSRAVNTITVLNAADTDIFQVAYTYS